VSAVAVHAGCTASEGSCCCSGNACARASCAVCGTGRQMTLGLACFGYIEALPSAVASCAPPCYPPALQSGEIQALLLDSYVLDSAAHLITTSLLLHCSLLTACSRVRSRPWCWTLMFWTVLPAPTATW